MAELTEHEQYTYILIVGTCVCRQNPYEVLIFPPNKGGGKIMGGVIVENILQTPFKKTSQRIAKE